MDLIIRWSTTVRNRRVPNSVFKGTLATDNRDKEMKTIWEFIVLREYRIGDYHEDVMGSTSSLFLQDMILCSSLFFLVNAGPWRSSY